MQTYSTAALLVINQFSKVGEYLPGKRGLCNLLKQPLNILTVSQKSFGLGGDISLHDGRRILRVKLHSPCTIANPKGVVLIMGVSGKNYRIGRQTENTLRMSGVGRKQLRNPPEKQVTFCFMRERYTNRADLLAERIIANLSSHGTSKKLVPVADTKQGHTRANQRWNP